MQVRFQAGSACIGKYMNDDLIKLSAQLGELLLKKGWSIATAESCTGGGVAAAITTIAGSSAWFGYGLVTYSNQAKEQLLGVKPETLELWGAVSKETVIEMAQGILGVSSADIAIAVSGIAGPGGGSPEKPVGGVWFAWMSKAGDLNVSHRQFAGDRQAIQRQAVFHALSGAIDFLPHDRQENTV